MLNNNNYREFTLDNGLKVALLKRPSMTISGGLRVFHSAVNEKKGEEGLAHFLEHMMLVGGSKACSIEQSNRLISYFGYFNARTFLDKMKFPVDMVSEDLEQYLQFTSNLAFHPNMDSSIVKRECKIVLQEMTDMKSEPKFGYIEAYREALCGDSPQNIDIIGKREVLKKVTSDDLRAFHSRGFYANNMDLVLVGELPRNIDDLIKKYFADKPSKEVTRFEFPSLEPFEEKKILHMSTPKSYNQEAPEFSSAHINLGFQVPPETSKESYALELFAYILGGNFNSRLMRRLRQAEGMVYHIGCSYDGSNNHGIMEVATSTLATNKEWAIDEIFNEFQDIQVKPVSSEELDLAKRKLKYEFAKVSDLNEGCVHFIQEKMDFGVIPSEYLKEINAVTTEQIMKVAQKYLPDQENGKYVLMMLDPLKKN